MVHLDNTTAPQWVRVPAAGDHAAADGVLALTSTVDASVKAALPFPIAAGVYQYAEAKLRLPAGLPDGEYAYTLSAEGRTLSQGIAIVGQYDRIPDGSGVENIEFKQYGE